MRKPDSLILLVYRLLCSKGSELRVISKIPEREKTRSPSPSNRLNDSPTFKKLDGSPVFKSEFIGHDSHDSIKEVDSFV